MKHLFPAVTLLLLLLPAHASAQGLPLPAKTFRRGKKPPAKKRLLRSKRKAHPDVAFQRRLQARARYLAASETPGVDLWTQVLELAVAHYGAREDLTVAQRFDRVMRDAGAVLVGQGPLEVGLAQVRSKDRLPIIRINGANDPLVDWVLRNYAVMNDVFAGKDLDPRAKSDFREGFRDGTENQVFHSFFYVLMAYFTGNHHTTSLGNLVHELRDPGGSAQDYDVGNWAAQLGEWLRRFRDEGNEKALYALPSMFGAMFSNDAQRYGRPEDNGGRDFRNVVRVIDHLVTEKLSNPTGGFVGEIKHRVHRGAIGLLGKLRGD